MSKKSNPAMIGAFVIGGVLLIAIGVAIFGGSELLARKQIYVAYFEDRVKGLRVGSNVLMNGVRIGYVSDIDLLADVRTLDTMSMVTMEIIPDTLVLTQNGRLIDAELPSMVSHDRLINEAGLRAQLAVESFVTGQLLVELELRPDSRPVMRGADPPYPEIPTVSSNIQELLNRVQTWAADLMESVDVRELGERVMRAVRGLDELSNSQELRQSIAGFNRLVNDEETQRLSASLQSAIQELRLAATDAGKLFRDTNDDVVELARQFADVADRLDNALIQAEQAIAAANAQLRGDTELAYEFQAALDELESAARSIREFFDYLERNPDSLLKGKQP